MPRKRETKKRTPLGGMVQKMQVPAREGFVRRWVNDDPGRLANFQEAGYEFVSDLSAEESNSTDVSSRRSMVVGKNDDGSPKRAYLMEQNSEFYEEDQATKQEELDQVDAAIQRGALNDDGENQYVPKGGIKYNPKKGR